LQIGETLTHGGRRYVVRGFDPEGVSPRMIYLEDVAKGTHRIVPFERLQRSSSRGAARLRLVIRAGEPVRGR
jgi:hypothetical protein